MTKLLNTRVLLSLGAIVFMIAAVVGATYAVWSAEATVENNTIAAATVTLALRGSENSETVLKPIAGPSTENMLPGDQTDWFHTTVENTGSTAGRVYMYIDNLQGTGGICANTNLEVQVKCDLEGTCDFANEPWAVYNGPVTAIDENNRLELTGAYGSSVFNPSLPEDWAIVVEQRAELDIDAPNTAQGQTCTWDEVFVLEPEVAS